MSRPYIRKPVIVSALRAVAATNNGILLPEAVVEAAKSKRSPLHGQFDWEDSVAGHNWRLWQARQLISVAVEHLPGPSKGLTKVFVSLSVDRKAGGYRELAQVLSHKQGRALLLADAARELEACRKRYGHLRELAQIFSVIRKAKLHRFVA